jgi:hypothetical protein
VIFLLLITGQTIIFLLRLVAADRREGRRRPMAGSTKTVGELADAAAETEDAAVETDVATDTAAEPATEPPETGT